MKSKSISTSEILESIDTIIPELTRIRHDIDKTLISFKRFRMERTVGDRSKITVILKAIKVNLEITYDELSSDNRVRRIKEARQIYCALAREITTLSYAEIGKKINRDHSTVMYSCRVMKDAKFTKDPLYDKYEVVLQFVLNTLD